MEWGVNTPDEGLYGEIQQMRTLAEDNIIISMVK
jgi:hypothetical protein